jgi:putative ABC transport system permease protein
MKQTASVISMNVSSIPQRLGMSIATIVSVAMMVGVLMGFLAIADGFRATLDGSGSDDIAVMVRAGSQAELNSALSRDQVRVIEAAPGVATGADGEPAVSGELYVIVDGVKRTTQTEANLALRGLATVGPSMRQNFSLIEGRMFEPGAAELIVGESVLREFEGFELNQTIRLGTNEWTVVGVFSTGGSVFDSEIWADLGVIQNLYQRGSGVQSIRARLDGPEALAALQAFAEEDPRLDLDIQTEAEYFADQASGTAVIISFLGWPLAITMAIGALAGAWNTMYSSVDSRTREIATLRAIGFSGWSAFVGTMVEALLLAFIGGIIGALGVYLIFNGMSAQTLGSGFTQVVFSFAVTAGSVITGIILALIVGFLGGMVPAIRAARLPLLAVHG